MTKDFSKLFKEAIERRINQNKTNPVANPISPCEKLVQHLRELEFTGKVSSKK